MKINRNRLEEVLLGNEKNYLYPFFWLHGADNSTLEDYVEHIYHSGCRAFCVESRPHPDFLGEKWWQDMEILLEKAKNLGMKIWILDDAHFPTGYANGRIKNAPKELKQWHIYHQEIDFTGPVRNGRIPVIDEKNREGGFVSEEADLVAAILVERTNGVGFDSNGIFLDVTEQIQNGWLKLNLPEGMFRLYIITKQLRMQNTFMDYIDMTNPESVHLLLEETYEKHYQHCKSYFGNVIEGFFSDEPGFYNSDNERGYSFQYQIGADMHLPWNSYIEEEFCQKLWEQGILSEKSVCQMKKFLPTLWFPCGENTEKIRAAFMDAITDLYKRNFTGQLSEWCHKHGVLYVGHVIEDNNCHARLGCGPGHYFRALSGQDMAGIDVVLQQIMPQKDYFQYGFSSAGPQDGAFNFYGLGKLGASMAHIDEKTQGRAMCEIFGAYGWVEGISMMKWLANHMLVRGLNVFVPHAFTEKEFPDGDCPPHFYGHGKNLQYPYMQLVFKYMNRMAHLLSSGSPMTDIGVLYHAEAEWMGRSMYFHTIGEQLMKNQMDYEVIPLDALEHAEYKAGYLVLGKLKLKCLLIPAADRYPERLKFHIEKCSRAGIMVYQVEGELPNNSREGNIWTAPKTNSGEVLENCGRIGLDELVSEMKKNQLCQMTLFPEKEPKKLEWLRYYHYRTEDERHVYMLFHEGSSGVIEGNLELPCMKQLIRYDAQKNVLYDPNYVDDTAISLRLYPGEAWVLFSDSNDKEKSKSKKTDFCLLREDDKTRWRVFKGGMMISGIDRFHQKKFTMWKEQIEWEAFDVEEEFPGFAGTLCYEFEIDSEDKRIAFLQLEYAKEVVSVWVNGKKAGTEIGEPYVFDLSAFSVKGKNQIRIEVTTTLAYEMKDVFSRHAVYLPEGIQGSIYYFLS